MIDKNTVFALVKSQLPLAEAAIVENITQDIVRDGEAVLHSMVRQATAQERENLFMKNRKA